MENATGTPLSIRSDPSPSKCSEQISPLKASPAKKIWGKLFGSPQPQSVAPAAESLTSTAKESFAEVEAAEPEERERKASFDFSLELEDYQGPSMARIGSYEAPKTPVQPANTPRDSLSEGGKSESPADNRKGGSVPLAEFDPLIPSDWMISFESPAVKNQQQAKPRTPLPKPSLIDALNDLATPTSIAKYSQRDLEQIRRNLTEKFEKEFELAQFELAELDQKRQAAELENKRIQETLKLWDETMNKMIQDRKNEKEEHSKQLEVVRTQYEKMLSEKDRTIKEGEVLTRKYKQIRIDYEDLKEVHESMRTENEELKQQVAAWQENFDKLKNHAQSKIDEANAEIKRVRENYDKEVSTLKAKLVRSDLQVKALENTVETKTRENQELTKICDDLLAQIEGTTTSSC